MSCFFFPFFFFLVVVGPFPVPSLSRCISVLFYQWGHLFVFVSSYFAFSTVYRFISVSYRFFFWEGGGSVVNVQLGVGGGFVNFGRRWFLSVSAGGGVGK